MPTVLFSFFLRLFLCYIYFSLPVAVCIFSFYIATSSCTHNLPVCMNPLGVFFFGGGVHRCGCCYLNRFPSLFRHGNVSLKVWHYKLIFIPSQTVIANVNLKNFHLKLWADGVWKMFADQKNFAELQGGIHSLKMLPWHLSPWPWVFSLCRPNQFPIPCPTTFTALRGGSIALRPCRTTLSNSSSRSSLSSAGGCVWLMEQSRSFSR